MNALDEGLVRFNQLPSEDAESVLLACCASPRWARAVAASRPYENPNQLYASAEQLWWDQPVAEWETAFSAHPRIGESSAARPQHGTGDAWSATEQKGALQADADIRERIAAANRAYEAKFGRTYIVCAAGKSAEQMLRIAQDRMNNDVDAELRIAAMEQSRITRIRLERTLTELTGQHT